MSRLLATSEPHDFGILLSSGAKKRNQLEKDSENLGTSVKTCRCT